MVVEIRCKHRLVAAGSLVRIHPKEDPVVRTAPVLIHAHLDVRHDGNATQDRTNPLQIVFCDVEGNTGVVDLVADTLTPSK